MRVLRNVLSPSPVIASAAAARKVWTGLTGGCSIKHLKWNENIRFLAVALVLWAAWLEPVARQKPMAVEQTVATMVVDRGAETHELLIQFIRIYIANEGLGRGANRGAREKPRRTDVERLLRMLGPENRSSRRPCRCLKPPPEPDADTTETVEPGS